MSEQTRPDPPREREPEVHVGHSPVRCPFCHEDVQVEGEAWVACAGCLARHHAECWSETARCGACKGTQSLAKSGPPVTTSPAPRLPEPDTLGWLAPWTGAPKRFTHRRTIEGEVDSEIDEVVVMEVRGRLGIQGRFERLGRTLTWTTLGSGGQQNAGRLVTVTVSSRDGKTTLEVDEDLNHQLLGAWLLATIFGGLGGLMSFIGAVEVTRRWPLGLVAAALVMTVIVALARLVYVTPYRSRLPEVAALTDALEAELRRRARRPRVDPKAQ